jgi:hypothetical protein
MARDFGHEDAGLATRESLDEITRTPSVDTFLETNDKRYLVGPKGSGKTLVLLRKAIDMRNKGNTVCIPSEPNRPVDRLDAAEHVGQKFFYTINDPDKRNLAWTTVWKHSILRSILHHVKDEISVEGGSRLDNDRIDHLIQTNSLGALRPFHYYRDITHLLDSAPHKTLDKIRDELFQLDQILQYSTENVHVFLDNLDDYYELEPDLWMQSMYGQFRAVREISLAHRHIHIYTSIRLDVYTQFQDEMRLQFFDYIAELSYGSRDLLQIFENRILQLDDDLLSEPSARRNDPWRAFFGEHTQIPNEYVGGVETIQDYITRHTLRRPRDLIHVGTILLNQRRQGEFTLGSIRDAVGRAAQDICKQYLAEVRPAFGRSSLDIKRFIANYIPSNVLTPKDIRKITDEYLDYARDSLGEDNTDFGCEPFEALYDIGLLGVQRRNGGENHYEQFFRQASQGLEEHILPQSKRYFLHPILSYPFLHDVESTELIVGQGLKLETGDNNE